MRRTILFFVLAGMLHDVNTTVESQSSAAFVVCLWKQKMRCRPQPFRSFDPREPLFHALVRLFQTLEIWVWAFARIYTAAASCYLFHLLLTHFVTWQNLPLLQRGFMWLFYKLLQVFFVHYLPWTLLRILLIRGGVEQNPGPGPIMRQPTREFEVRTTVVFT